MNVWRTTALTPLYDNTLNVGSIDRDIDGQVRPIISNPGADHYSLESIRYKPLTPDDVGPNAFEDGTTSVNQENQSSDFIAYPIPTNNFLHIKGISPNAVRYELLNSNGTHMRVGTISNPSQETSINVSELNSGIYFLKISNDLHFEIFNIIIEQ